MKNEVVRSLSLLIRAAPLKLSAHLAVTVLHGAAIPILIRAIGGLLQQLLTTRSSGWSLLVPLIVIVVVIAGADVLGILGAWLLVSVSNGLDRAVSSLLMSAALRPYGIGHLEDAGYRNKLALTSAAERGPLAFYGTTVGLLFWLSSALGGLLLLLPLGWWIGVLLILSVVPSLLSNWRASGRQTQAVVEGVVDARRSDYHFGLAFEVDASKELRILNAAEWIADRESGYWKSATSAFTRALRTEAMIETSAGLLRALSVTVGGLVAIRAAVVGDLPMPLLAQGLLAMIALQPPLLALAVFPSELRQASRFFPHMWELVDASASELRGAPTTSSTRGRTPRIENRIQFEGVWFRYRPDLPWVLKDCNFVLPARTCTALVGPNGAGKSTIVKLLCGFYEPSIGSVSVDGVDLLDLDPAQYRRLITTIFQDFARYPLSVRDNVRIACLDGRPGQIESALAVAGASSLLRRQDDHPGAPVGRNLGGSDFSEGEWQRIALARALAALESRDAQLVLLDEPSASLDVRIEFDLLERMKRILPGRTSLLVSHRLSTVNLADRIVYLKNGTVVEQGLKRDLLRSQSHFKEAYSSLQDFYE